MSAAGGCMSTQAENNQRRVRPWIAALLTLLSWGLGLYYARRTRAAIWMAAFMVVFGIVLAAALVLYALSAETLPIWLFNADGSTANFLSLAISAVVATGVWFAVAKRQHVEKAGAVRLLGYVAIVLVPLFISLSLAMAVRWTTVQPFRIPSGAMQPTLNVGDYIFVSKWSYGYSRYSFAPFEGLVPAHPGRWRARQPERGDIVVFRPTPEPNRDFVKRVVGMPGDRIQMIGGVLNINGTPVARESAGERTIEDGAVVPVYRETLPNGVSYLTAERGETELDNTREFIVPADSFFLMGDDRDNSADSRVPSVVGFVPFENLVGRVDHVATPR